MSSLITKRINNRMIEQNKNEQGGAAAVPTGVEPFIGKGETARRLDCGVRTLDSWMRRGIVPFYKVSKRVMFRWSEVQAVLERNCRVDRGGWKI